MPGRGTRSLMPQLSVCMLQLKNSQSTTKTQGTQIKKKKNVILILIMTLYANTRILSRRLYLPKSSFLICKIQIIAISTSQSS